MIKEAWLNFPVKDLEKAKAFYTKIGFTPSEQGNSEVSAAFKIGTKQISLMLFEAGTFAKISGNALTDTSKGSEILVSIDAESVEEVDTLAQKVISAGGNVFSKPQETQGWLYGFGFTDPDGHRWNAIYMDFSKMKQTTLKSII